ncbi:hypothetical protein [Saccharopolyspora gregorii]|uniref:hypothetical protein n=1 Tax=Saccharopolyspora gregorii TaxID=33914 RepID=UPI0031EAC9F8
MIGDVVRDQQGGQGRGEDQGGFEVQGHHAASPSNSCAGTSAAAETRRSTVFPARRW